MVDAYYNRFQDLLDELSEVDQTISTHEQCITFFLLLQVQKFKKIQHNFCIGKLSYDWNIQD